LYPTELVRSIGGFYSGTRTNGGHEDYDLLLRLASQGVRAISVHEIGVRYYKYEGSMSTNGLNMARTRVLAWLESLPFFLEEATGEIIMAALIGWWRLANCTPNNFENEIKKAAEVLISACTNSPKQLEAMSAELESLYEKMDRFEGSRVDSLKKAIKPFLSKELNATYRVHPQAIIDRRFDFQEKKILATLRLVSSIYPEQYAIYGAGALGRSLLKGFDSIGFLPAYMVDRNPDGCGLMPSNVPVITLSEAKAKGISNFLISSYSYYDSILSDIRAVYGNDFNVL